MNGQASTAPELLGAEMLFWSAGPGPVRSGVAPRLIAHAVPAGSRVLLVGPEDQPLIDGLVEHGADLTVLIRAYADGVQIVGRNTANPGVHVVVGDITRLPIGDGFDAVIALAGLDRVLTAEGRDLDWAEIYSLLRSALRPEGTLLLAVDNPLGLHRMVELQPWYADRDNAAWRLPGVCEPGRPRILTELRAMLAADGLTITGEWGAYPLPERPTALVATASLDAPGDYVGAIESVLADACATGFAGVELLRDPWPLASSALHAGAASALAPAWWICARAGAAVELDLPVVLLADEPVELVADGSTMLRRPAPTSPSAPSPVPAQAMSLDQTDVVPAGRLLREVLIDGCLRRDLLMLRRTLTAYADWLFANATDQGDLLAPYAYATLDNVVRHGDDFAVLNPRRGTAPSRPAVEVLATSLRRFAFELETVGYAHPWPSTLGVDGLTVVLGGASGRDLEETLLRVAEEPWLLPAQAIGSAPSFQELREANIRQREELSRLTERLAWSEKMLSSREFHLSKAQRKLDLLSGSLTYRVGKLAVKPLRWGKRQAGRIVRAAQDDTPQR